MSFYIILYHISTSNKFMLYRQCFITYYVENSSEETPQHTEQSASEQSQPFQHLMKDFMVVYDINKGRCIYIVIF